MCCLMDEGIMAKCCVIDSKPSVSWGCQLCWEDTAMGDGGKQGWLLWVNKQHCVWGSDCQQGAVPLAS